MISSFVLFLYPSLDNIVVIDGAIAAVAVHDPAASSSCNATNYAEAIIEDVLSGKSHRILTRHLLEQVEQWIEHLTSTKALLMRHRRSGLQVVAFEAKAHHVLRQHLIAGAC